MTDMQIAGLQKFSLIDYPGEIAALIFTRGCGFRCDFCHNPELVDPKRYASLIPEEAIWQFLATRQNQLTGVAISGGDPTVQADLIPFLQKIKNLGFKIKLDTTGSLPAVIEQILKLQLVDYIAMDIKGPLARYHEIIHSHVDLARLQTSIDLLMHSGIAYEFRTTIVKGMLSVAEVVSIGRDLIPGAQHYFLQHFIPSKTLNPEFMKRLTWSEAEFETAQTQLLPYVTNCTIR
jgi:pyruvate formate lyase activating enzyme